MNFFGQVQYFEILRAIHRGGLSLWLNRRTLLPMTMVPTVVTFLTLMLARGFMPEDSSAFLLSVIKIPADFVTGVFCALVIFIIANAPKKRDSDKPVIFTLNLNEKKGIFMTAAIGHVVLGYFSGGLFGLIYMIYEPVLQAAQNKEELTLSTTNFVIISALLFVLYYGLRFLFLPILIVAQAPVREFFARYRQLGMSFPVFAVKSAITVVLAFCVMMMSSLFLAGSGGSAENVSFIQFALLDFTTSFASVVATAWAYAALTVGYRQMTEGKEQ